MRYVVDELLKQIDRYEETHGHKPEEIGISKADYEYLKRLGSFRPCPDCDAEMEFTFKGVPIVYNPVTKRRQ